MTGPIGFQIDDEEEWDDEDGEEFDVEMVGEGCADFTPVEPTVTLDDMVKAARKLKKLGAKRCKIGDFEVDF